MSIPEVGEVQEEYVRSLMAGLIDSLVDGHVTVRVMPSDAFSSLEKRAPAEIMSVLVGPKGQMARALRTRLAGSAAKLGRKYALDMVVSTQRADGQRFSQSQPSSI